MAVLNFNRKGNSQIIKWTANRDIKINCVGERSWRNVITEVTAGSLRMMDCPREGGGSAEGQALNRRQCESARGEKDSQGERGGKKQVKYSPENL